MIFLLIFRLIVAQIVKRLQNQYLEHQHRIERMPTGIAFTLVTVSNLKNIPEILPWPVTG